MEYLLTIFGILFSIIGLIGCLIPNIPAPLINYLALILLHFSKENGAFSYSFIFGLLVMTIMITALEYVLPNTKNKFLGASKHGSFGAFIGMIVGLLTTILSHSSEVFIIILSVFLGSIIGEIIMYKRKEFKSVENTDVLGYTIATVMKFSASAVMALFYFQYI